MSKVYKYCNFSILSGVTATLTTGATTSTTQHLYGLTIYVESHPLTITLSSPISSDIIIYWKYWSKVIDKGVTTFEGWSQTGFFIPAGQTIYTVSEQSYSHLTATTPLTNLETFICCEEIVDQPSIPTECTGQPTGCTLASLGAVITAPSARGEDDAKIAFHISGATGTSLTYKLNGVTIITGSTSTTGFTFTGLTTGVYNATVYENFCYAQETDIVVPEGLFSTGTMTVSAPSSITAANNPVVLQLQTTINNANPVPAKGRFRVTGTVTDGDTITMSFTYPQAYTATYTAKKYPDKNTFFLATQIATAAGTVIGTNTTSEIATSIAEVLQQDLVIRRLFYITNDTSYVYLTAKENTPNLNLNSNSVQISSTGILHSTLQDGVGHYDGQLTADYSLYAEVYVDPDLQFGASPNPNNFVRVGELELPFQRDNIHQFQLDTILKNYVSTPKIDFTSTGFTTIPSHDTAYFIKYGEKFPLITNSTTKKKRYKGKTTYLHTVNSALNWEDPNDMAEYLGDSLSDLNPAFSYTGGFAPGVTFTNYTGGTGATNIKFSLWNHTNTNKIYGWQTSPHFSGFSASTYYVHISATTNGIPFTVTQPLVTNPAYTSLISLYTVMPRNNVKWMTNSPQTLYVQRNSKQYLSFLLEKGYATASNRLSCKGDVYYYNGTSTTGVTFFNITTSATTNFGGMTSLAVGYNELGLAALENSGSTKVRRVDFAVYQIVNSVSMPLTQVKTFLYEIDEAPTRFGVAFLNKLGAWDIYDFCGEIVYDENITREDLQKPRAIFADGSSPYGFEANSVFNTQYTPRTVVNSSSIDQDTYVWLQELLQSNRIYSYTSEHQNFMIVDGWTSQKSTNTSEFALQVVLKESLYENNVSV